MKKIVALVFSLAVAALAAVPFIAGNQAEKEVNRFVESINKSADYSAKIDSYEKSYLDSKVVLIFEVKSDQVKEAFQGVDLSLPVDLKIKHGPFVASDQGALGLFSYKVLLQDKHDGLVKSHVKAEKDGPFYEMQGMMNFSKQLVFSDRIVPFSVSHDDFSIEVAEYAGDGSLDQLNQYEYEGELPSLTLSVGENKTVLNGTKFSMVMDISKGYIEHFTPGYAEFSMQKVSVSGEQKASLDGLFFKIDTKIDDAKNVANIVMDIGLEQGKFGEEHQGELALSVSYKNLDVEFLEEMIDSFSSQSADPATANQKMMALVTEKLLPASPGVSIDKLFFKTNEGEFNGKLDFSIQGDRAAGAPLDFSNPFAMIPLLKVSADLDMDKKLADWIARENTRKQALASIEQEGLEKTDEEVEAMVDAQAPVMLQMLMMQGLVLEEGEKLKSNFEFADGVAKVNGNEMPMPF